MSIGPMCIPFVDMSGEVGGWPHRPASYGRYFPIDLDANNRHSIDAYCKRLPDRPRPTFGWGVCRSGFGLQDSRERVRPLGRPLTETEADAWAVELNASIAIGADPRPPAAIEAAEYLRAVRRRSAR